ncbi:MAG: pyridoxine 5'-phosphate synthase [Gammaproteobacteria bacterium]|nr:MAG: pyridoxine 5'-phosphate synthase [Gammaproteobacteria bacterium]
MTQLSVNLNKIALLRNARGRDFPNVVVFAEMALKAGADGLTIHPRPDQRHARYDDIAPLKALCEQYHAELNIEGYPEEQLIDLCIENRVQQMTLVPDSPAQITSDHGWTVSEHITLLTPILARLRAAGIRSSLFMDTNADEIRLAPSVGADRIELHTESYARSVENHSHETHIHTFAAAYQTAVEAGLGVNAGHDLDLNNLGFFLAHVPVAEVSIGHALTVEALQFGWDNVISRYKSICQQRG